MGRRADGTARHPFGRQVHGFRTDHSGILDDAAVFSRLAGVLAALN